MFGFKTRFKVNKGSIEKKVFSPNSKTKAVALEKVTEKVEEVKAKFMDEFETHPVTKEIEAGPDSRNISKTLIGDGNLFTFIGFNEGENPIAGLREALENSFKVKKSLFSFNISGKKRQYEFKVSVPSMEELENLTPMPSWDSSRSWLKGIESGISGYNRYMFKRLGFFKNSRSGKGLQAKGVIRAKKGTKFVNTRYMSRMLRTVYRRLGIWK